MEEKIGARKIICRKRKLRTDSPLIYSTCLFDDAPENSDFLQDSLNNSHSLGSKTLHPYTRDHLRNSRGVARLANTR